jgi:hypothetical protein
MRAEERGGQGLPGFLCYNDNIRLCVETLGRDNTGIFPLEFLAREPERYYHELSDFLSVDAGNMQELSRGRHHNPRLLAADVEFMRHIAEDSEKLACWRAQSVAQRRKAFRAMRESHGSEEHMAPASIEMSNDFRTLVAQSTAERHRWLSEQFGLPLDDFGYPC